MLKKFREINEMGTILTEKMTQNGLRLRRNDVYRYLRVRIRKIMNQAKCKQTAEFKSHYLSIGFCIHNTISPLDLLKFPHFYDNYYNTLTYGRGKGGQREKFS